MTDLQKIVFLKKYDNICPICNKEFIDKRRATRHITETHAEFMKDIARFREEYNLASRLLSVECPICKVSFKEISRHVKHKHGMSVDAFKYKYPLVPLKSMSSLPERVLYICDICGKECNGKNTLVKHYQQTHPKNVSDVKPADSRYKHYDCPICKVKTSSIRNHVCDGHGISWPTFCDEYNWDIKDSKYISDEYRNALSINKKQYYVSDAGIKRKKLQSIAMHGDKNISCRPEIRSKISAKAIKNMEENPFFNQSYGIKTVFTHEGKRYSLRSFEELKTVVALLLNNVDFEYEKTKIRYEIEPGVYKHYILDIEINNKYYEIKSNKSLTSNNKIKYMFVQRELSKINKKLNIVTSKILFENVGIKPVDIVQFCKDKLQRGEMWLTCYTYKQNSRILYSIDENYKNNENIKFVVRKSKCNLKK